MAKFKELRQQLKQAPPVTVEQLQLPPVLAEPETTQKGGVDLSGTWVRLRRGRGGGGASGYMVHILEFVDGQPRVKLIKDVDVRGLAEFAAVRALDR